jgi:hypothetical protein
VIDFSKVPALAGRTTGRVIAASAVAALLSASAPHVRAAMQEPGPGGSPIAVEHLGFRFSPGTCEQSADFCAASVPRPWAPDHIELVRRALDDIASKAIGRRIIDRAQANGFRTLRRYAQAARRNEQQRYEAQPLIVAITHSDDDDAARTIDVTDRFFERGSARDHFSGQPGYLLTTEILAHELTHAVDLDQQYSSTAEFRRIGRLGMTAAQQVEADKANVERERLTAEGQFEAAWHAGRTFALIALRGRLPSVYSLDNYREAFAEYGAHLVLDPNSRKQFEPRLIQYFERVVSGGQ